MRYFRQRSQSSACLTQFSGRCPASDPSDTFQNSPYALYFAVTPLFTLARYRSRVRCLVHNS